MVGHAQTHPAFNWIWNSKCQPKHKVFLWLLLQDRLSTRNILRRRNMHLDSYTCENCILQREETIAHLFLRCNFAKACWLSIGVISPSTSCPKTAVARLRRQLNVPFWMEIITLMAWSIWKARNGWIF